MNAVEHIVESYFRFCRGCFTMADYKVPNGNNRQFDLLAFNVKTGEQYHIESGVTHCENWCPTTKKLVTKFNQKFLGVPKEKEGENTDFGKGKTYKAQIWAGYRSVGFDPEKVQRPLVLLGRERPGPTAGVFGIVQGRDRHHSQDVVVPRRRVGGAAERGGDGELRRRHLADDEPASGTTAAADRQGRGGGRHHQAVDTHRLTPTVRSLHRRGRGERTGPRRSVDAVENPAPGARPGECVHWPGGDVRTGLPEPAARLAVPAAVGLKHDDSGGRATRSRGASG